MGSSTKKDLEIIYNLQWKRGPDDKSNIVGMYDVPATTLNWETFKSYLLKNSGTVVDDVKVSYVSSDDKEFPIESQLDFQIALYSFRQRARNNDVITLRLDNAEKSSDTRVKRPRAAPQSPINDDIPAWFKDYMTEYKKETADEVARAVVAALANAGVKTNSRKSKDVAGKRLQKLADSFNKETRKSLKLERKIEHLEEKTNKIREKKAALAAQTIRPPIGQPPTAAELLMDASPVGRAEQTAPHMLGGEICRQEWTIRNTGSVAWTAETELRYAWGSEALKPIETSVPCPHLQPGEDGSVAVFLEVPDVPGEYECYWHFAQSGCRFGHWLGCHVVVDPSPPPLQQPVDDVSKELDALALSSDSDNQSVESISTASVRSADDFVIVAEKPPPCAAESAYVEGPKQPPPSSPDQSLFDGIGSCSVRLGTYSAENSVELHRRRANSAGETTFTVPLAKATADNRLFVFPHGCSGFEIVRPTGMTDSVVQEAAVAAAAATPEPSNPRYYHAVAPQPVPSPCPASSQHQSFTFSTPSWYFPNVAGPQFNPPGVGHVMLAANPAPPVPPQQPQPAATPIVMGAMNVVASSAMNTARSVVGMFYQRQPETERDHAHRLLGEMGFLDRQLNDNLLERYGDNIAHVIEQLLMREAAV